MAAPNPASPPDSSPTSPSTEVSWQTCFWILATLALNNMAQPCGKVLESPARNSIYMRSSPFIAFADTLSIPIRIIYTSISLGVPLRKSLWLFFSWRFEDYDSDEGLANEGLGNIAKSMWLRWVLLILGPLPQALRLASFGGIIFTKILGFSFLVNWFAVEALLYFAARYQRQRGTLRASLQIELSAGQLCDHEWKTLDDLQEVFDRVMVLAALCSPLFIIYNLMVQIYMLQLKNLKDSGSYSGGLMVFALYFGLAVFGLMCWFGVLGLIDFFEKFPRLARYLLVTKIRHKGFPEVVDEDSVFCLFFFFFNLGTVVLCYSLWYDPSGTNNPGWSAVFG